MKMFNFEDSMRLLLDNKAAVQVNDWYELGEKFIYYLNHKEEMKEKGNRARNVIFKNKGASQKNVDLALKLLDGQEC
ncbi:MAG: hypothetical protein ACOC1K_03795 [Nanoarchaeota archaeon]